MRILIVANHNSGRFSPFVTEQVEAIKQMEVVVDYFGVQGKGIFGYLSNRSSLKLKIRDFRPDIIHAHYGLSGLLANLQRKVPVITTYHGSDIHSRGRNLFFSRLSMWLSSYNIFVTEKLQKEAAYNGSRQCVIPCGVDTTAIYQIDRMGARKQLGWKSEGKYVLFAGAFDNSVKNSSLAKMAVSKLEDVQLVEMRGFNRQQVNLVINAADCLLMTSHREGSPQVIKEAMACGTPIVTVSVGDVQERLKGIDGCYVTKTYEPKELADALLCALNFEGRTAGRKAIFSDGLDNKHIAEKVVGIYKKCIEGKA